MHRCLELAVLSAGYVAPNPMVGAVLVHDGKIIGEGYHQFYGGPHAEVNCLQSVSAENRHLISSSTLYVSLEPCAHHGKTPPCSDLIIRNKIPQVIIGCRDPFIEVDGKGIEKLHAAGISTIVGVLEKECKSVNRRFLNFHTEHRPYIILKWAQTADNKIGLHGERLYITGSAVNRLVHRWRSEEASILVGTNTALDDDPHLTNRLSTGKTPLRVVIDLNLKLPASLKVFDDAAPVMVINTIKHGQEGNIFYYEVTHDVSIPLQTVNALYQQKILSVIVEGGARLLQSFIDEELWDEARVITNKKLFAEHGIAAPEFKGRMFLEEEFMDDIVRYYERF